MIDTKDWNYIYKSTHEGIMCSTNAMYTPLSNHEGTIMCMHWDETSSYLKNDKITKELVNFFFERECKYIQLFQDKSWCPKLLEINNSDRKIFIEWSNITLNHIWFTPGKNLHEICPTWKDQIFKILKDIKELGFYKMALYPHCFYLKDDVIKTFDFYSCVGIEERYIKRSDLEGMIGKYSSERFDLSTTEDGMIDFKKFIEITMTQWLGTHWPYNPFPTFYKKIYLGEV